MIDDTDRWVPDNLSKLQKLLGKSRPLLYGLPMFHLYYTTPKDDNRYDGRNNFKHAFRIIVGLAWNWAICDLSGEYKMNKDRMKASITSQLLQFMGKKTTEVTSHAWWVIARLAKESDSYKLIEELFSEIVLIHDLYEDDCQLRWIKRLRELFENKLSKYATDNVMLAVFVPKELQQEYKDTYKIGKVDGSVDAFKCMFQMEIDVKYDNTLDMNAWIVTQDEEFLRKYSFLSPKQVQRLLTKVGRNSKANHGRRNNERNK